MANITDIRAPGNDRTNRPSPQSSFSARRRLLGEFLIKIHLLAGREYPDAATEGGQASWTLLLGTWETALADIPDQHLGECLDRAIKAHRSSFMLTSGDVLTAWDGLREELLRYPAAPVPVAGYLPSGAPEPYYDLRPAIKALRDWSKRLGWAADDSGSGRLVKRADGLLVGYALNVKRRNDMSVADTVAWIDEMGAIVQEAGGDFDELLAALHATERLPLRPEMAPSCPVCADRRWVRDERLNVGPNLPFPGIGCPRCNPGAEGRK
jgi:hypothetical protein